MELLTYRKRDEDIITVKDPRNRKRKKKGGEFQGGRRCTNGVGKGEVDGVASCELFLEKMWRKTETIEISIPRGGKQAGGSGSGSIILGLEFRLFQIILRKFYG